ncbi:MAG: LUD domain-containing protein [Pseudomonadota bacterium]
MSTADSADARSRVLAKLRKAVAASGMPGATDAPETRGAAVAGRLAERAQGGPIPTFGRLEEREKVDRFTDQLGKLSATYSRLPSLQALPYALAEALRERNLPASIRMGEDPDFAALSFEALDVSVGPGRVEEPATLSRAVGAIAETGQLILLSGPRNPVTLTFLGDAHFILLRASEIEAGYEGAWARLRRMKADPRTVNLVAGPSRTADIGQQLELGAHGPVSLHVFLVDDV